MMNMGAISAAVAGIAKGAADFAKAASEGSFAISERGGQALLEAIREMGDWIDAQSHRLSYLQQDPRLGTSHGAQAMRPYVQEVATDQQGFITMLQAFRVSLDQAENGIREAMNNYRSLDAGVAGKYNV
jgi:hypothetical protein